MRFLIVWVFWGLCCVSALTAESDVGLCQDLLKEAAGVAPQTLIVNETVIDAVEGDLQSVLDCLAEGGTLLFNASTVETADTLNIETPLNIGSARTARENGIARVWMKCPKDKPALTIRSRGVSVSDLLFRDCELNGSSVISIDSKSEVEVTNVECAGNVNRNGPGCVLASNASLTVYNSSFESNTGVRGGAISADQQSTLSIFGSRFERNFAAEGGAVEISNSSITIKDGAFGRNRAEKRGGAVYLQDSQEAGNMSMILNNVHLYDNVVGVENGAEDPASMVTNATEPLIDKAPFLGKIGTGGGAIFVKGVNGKGIAVLVDFENVRFENNSAQSVSDVVVGRGGGIYAETVKMRITNGSFAENSAYHGGAIFALGSEDPEQQMVVEVEDAHFESNKGMGKGLAVYGNGGAIAAVRFSLLQVSNASFIQNSAMEGGAISGRGFLDEQRTEIVTISNSTFKENVAVSPGVGGGGAVVAFNFSELHIDHCLLEGNTGGEGGGVTVVGQQMEIFISHTNVHNNTSTDWGGGMVLGGLTGPINATITASNFSRNSGKLGAGAILIAGDVAAKFRNVDFLRNTGTNGGAITIVDNAKIDIDSCRFHANNGANGGALNFLHDDVTVHAFQELDTMIITISRSSFENNTAGGLFWRPADVDDWPLLGIGGAILVNGAATNFTLSNSTIRNNKATTGGGIFFRRGRLFTLENTDVRENQALVGGGMRADLTDMLTQKFSVAGCVFEGNSAKEGGAVSLFASAELFESLSTLNYTELRRRTYMENVEFRENSGFGHGGAMEVENVLMVCENCTFLDNNVGARNSSVPGIGKGGAIYVGRNAGARLNLAVVQGNWAGTGGGMYIENGFMDGVRVELTGNRATESGGAVAVHYGALVTTSDGILASCTSCLVAGNQAGIGGGLHVAVERDSKASGACLAAETANEPVRLAWQSKIEISDICTPAADLPGSLSERHVLLRNTTLLGNRAAKAGAAVYSSNTRLVRICCNYECEPSDKRGLSKAPCPAQGPGRWEQNTVKEEGVVESVVASLVSGVELSPTRITQYSSGDLLPRVTVTLKDAFDQVVYGQNASLMVRSTQPDILSGVSDTEIFLTGGRKVISGIVLRAEPGTYTLQFIVKSTFAGSWQITEDLNVTIRQCRIGEFFDDESLTCFECKTNFYNFDGTDRCLACPENARCNGSTLAPLDGFWHASSQAANVQPCLFEDACKLGSRTNRLSDAAYDAHFRGEALTWVDGRYPQCTKGYTGRLCGSCQDGYGKNGPFECGECPSQSLSVLLLVSFFCVVFLVVFFLIRKAVKYALQFESQDIGSEAPPDAETAENGDPPNERARDHEDGMQEVGISALQANQTMEVLKILVNFLQVVGMAATINVNWTESVMKILSISEFVSGVASAEGLLSFDCAFASSRISAPIATILYQLSIPVALVLIFSAYWVGRTVTLGLGRNYLRRRAVLSILVIIYIAYTSITKIAVGMFGCVRIDTSLGGEESTAKYWIRDTSIECFKNQHAVLVGILGGPLLFLALLGPFALTLKLRRNKHRLNDVDFVAKYGFLYKAYRPKGIFWEAVVMIRKALLATIVTLSKPLGPDRQGLLAVCVLLLAQILQRDFKPYNDAVPNLNIFEIWSLRISTLAFMAGLLFNAGEEVPAARVILSVVVIVIVVGFGVGLAYVVSASAMTQIKEWLASKGIRVESFKDLRKKCGDCASNACSNIKSCVSKSNQQPQS